MSLKEDWLWIAKLQNNIYRSRNIYKIHLFSPSLRHIPPNKINNYAKNHSFFFVQHYSGEHWSFHPTEISRLGPWEPKGSCYANQDGLDYGHGQIAYAYVKEQKLHALYWDEKWKQYSFVCDLNKCSEGWGTIGSHEIIVA